LDGNFPSDWQYVGDFELNIDHRFPDFKHKTLPAVIEVFAPYFKVKLFGSVKRYKQISTKHYKKANYAVLYLMESEVYRYPEEVVKRVAKFVSLVEAKQVMKLT
jgi:hypothetical protein